MTDEQIRQAFEKWWKSPGCWDAESAFSEGYKAALASLELQGYSYTINDTHLEYSVDEPPDDAYDEGSLVTLFRIKDKS